MFNNGLIFKLSNTNYLQQNEEGGPLCHFLKTQKFLVTLDDGQQLHGVKVLSLYHEVPCLGHGTYHVLLHEYLYPCPGLWRKTERLVLQPKWKNIK